jgi:hypothetical protein
MIKKIRILTVVFDAEISGHELPAFRGAIVDKVGKANILFHNHLDDKAFLYRYPLIQYKRIGKKPCILCIDYGVDEIHKFFENDSWDVKISDRWLNMKIDRLNLNQFTMQVWDRNFDYSIRNWIALNQENYKRYNGLESLQEKIAFLEKTLTANILAFAKGIDWQVDKQLNVKIKEMQSQRAVTLKEQKVIGFNLDFASNVFLPDYIGLGKSVSLGYGLVKHLKNNHQETK